MPYSDVPTPQWRDPEKDIYLKRERAGLELVGLNIDRAIEVAKGDLQLLKKLIGTIVQENGVDINNQYLVYKFIGAQLLPQPCQATTIVPQGKEGVDNLFQIMEDCENQPKATTLVHCRTQEQEESLLREEKITRQIRSALHVASGNMKVLSLQISQISKDNGGIDNVQLSKVFENLEIPFGYAARIIAFREIDSIYMGLQQINRYGPAKEVSGKEKAIVTNGLDHIRDEFRKIKRAKRKACKAEGKTLDEGKFIGTFVQALKDSAPLIPFNVKLEDMAKSKKVRSVCDKLKSQANKGGILTPLVM